MAQKILSEDFAEGVILTLWFIYFLTIGTEWSRSYFEAVVVVSPIFILMIFGVGWLKKYSWNNWIFLAILQFWLVSFLTQLSTVNIWYGLDGIRSFNLKFLAIFFSLLFVLRKELNFSRVLWAITGMMFIFSIFGYYNYLTPKAWHLEAMHPHNPDFVVSPFGQAFNNFAAYISIYLPIVFGLFYKEYYEHGFNKMRTILPSIVTFFTLPVLVLSYSRASQGAVILSLFTILLVMFIKTYDSLNIIIIFGIIGTILIGYYTVGDEAIRKWKRSDFSSLSGRVHNKWPEAINKTRDYRWLGTDFSEESSIKIFGFNKGGHSLYLYFLMRTGVLGLISFFLMSFFIIIQSIRNLYQISSKPGYVAINCGVLMTFIGGFLVKGLVAVPPSLVFNLTPIILLNYIVNQKKFRRSFR